MPGVIDEVTARFDIRIFPLGDVHHMVKDVIVLVGSPCALARSVGRNCDRTGWQALVRVMHASGVQREHGQADHQR